MKTKLLALCLALSVSLNAVLLWRAQDQSLRVDPASLATNGVLQLGSGLNPADEKASVDAEWQDIASDLRFLFASGDVELAVASALAESRVYPVQVDLLLDAWMLEADRWVQSDSEKNWEKAFTFLDAIAAARYQSVEYLIIKADASFLKGDYQIAIDDYFELINTSRGPAQQLLVTRLQRRLEILLAGVNEEKNWHLGVSIVERLLWHRPDDGEFLLLSARMNIELARYQLARASLSQALSLEDYSFRAQELIRQIDLLEKQKTAIALTAIGESQFLAKGFLNASTAVSLLVDTGASLSVLERSYFERVASKLNPKFVQKAVFRTAGGEVEAPIYRFKRFNLGGFEISDFEFAVLDYTVANNNNGLLGMNFLSKFDFEIDQNSALLVLEPRI